MVPIVQAPLPVVSTEYFSFGPNEGFSVQEFLRDLIRSSSHAAKTNFVPPDQEYVTHQGETLALPLILGNAAIPDQLQSSSTNVSNNRPSPLHQPPAPKGPVKRERNVLRVDSQLDRGVNTNLPRIVHTYSKKQKGIAQEQPERSREERPEKGKKRCRRAPVEGLVLIHRVSDQGAHPTEPQVSWNPTSPVFARKVLLRILALNVAFDPCGKDRKLTSFSMNKTLRKFLTLTAILSRVIPSHHQNHVVDDQSGTRTQSQLENRSVLRSPVVKVMWIQRTFEFHNGSLRPQLIGVRGGHRAVALVSFMWIPLAKESASNPRY